MSDCAETWADEVGCAEGNVHHCATETAVHRWHWCGDCGAAMRDDGSLSMVGVSRLRDSRPECGHEESKP